MVIGWMAAIPAGVALKATAVPAAAAGNVVTVRMHAFMFCSNAACTQDRAKGDIVTIHTGDVIKWVWDETPGSVLPLGCDNPLLQLPLPVNCPGHTTTASTKGTNGAPLWNSGTCAAPDGHAAPGAAGCPFSVTFNQPGSFGYFCVFHGGTNANNPVTKMNGLIVVQGPAVGSSAQGGGGGGGVTASNPGSSGAPDSSAVSADTISAFVPGLPDTGSGSRPVPVSMAAIALALTMLGAISAMGAALALLPRRH